MLQICLCFTSMSCLKISLFSSIILAFSVWPSIFLTPINFSCAIRSHYTLQTLSMPPGLLTTFSMSPELLVPLWTCAIPPVLGFQCQCVFGVFLVPGAGCVDPRCFMCSRSTLRSHGSPEFLTYCCLFPSSSSTLRVGFRMSVPLLLLLALIRSFFIVVPRPSSFSDFESPSL